MWPGRVGAHTRKQVGEDTMWARVLLTCFHSCEQAGEGAEEGAGKDSLAPDASAWARVGSSRTRLYQTISDYVRLYQTISD